MKQSENDEKQVQNKKKHSKKRRKHTPAVTKHDWEEMMGMYDQTLERRNGAWHRKGR